MSKKLKDLEDDLDNFRSVQYRMRNGINFSQMALGSLRPSLPLAPGRIKFPASSYPYQRMTMRYCAAV